MPMTTLLVLKPEFRETFVTGSARIVGTLIGGGLGITVALVLSQGFVPRPVEMVMKNINELLAAIPSEVYGLWGIVVLVPAYVFSLWSAVFSGMAIHVHH